MGESHRGHPRSLAKAIAGALLLAGCFADNGPGATGASTDTASDETDGETTVGSSSTTTSTTTDTSDSDATTTTTDPTTSTTAPTSDDSSTTATSTTTEPCPEGHPGCPCEPRPPECLEGLMCEGGVCVLAPACGDGFPEGDEQCDDGNQIQGDGCNNDCAPSGTLTWQEEVDGARAHDVAVADDGSIYVVGQRGENKQSNAWIAEFTPEGDIVWEDVLDFFGDEDIAYGIDITAEGDLVFVGLISSGLLGQARGFVYKYSADGVAKWNNPTTFGNNFETGYLTDVTVADSGTIYAAGVYITQGGTRAMFARINSGGGGFSESIDNGTQGFNNAIAVADATRYVTCGHRIGNTFAAVRTWDSQSLNHLETLTIGAGQTTSSGCVLDANDILLVSVYIPDQEAHTLARVSLKEPLSLLDSTPLPDAQATGLVYDPTTFHVIASGRSSGDIWLRRADPLDYGGEPFWMLSLADDTEAVDHAQALTLTPEGDIVSVGWIDDADPRAWIGRFTP